MDFILACICWDPPSQTILAGSWEVVWSLMFSQGYFLLEGIFWGLLYATTHNCHTVFGLTNYKVIRHVGFLKAVLAVFLVNKELLWSALLSLQSDFSYAFFVSSVLRARGILFRSSFSMGTGLHYWQGWGKERERDMQENKSTSLWDWNLLYVLLFAVHAKTVMGTRAKRAS